MKVKPWFCPALVAGALLVNGPLFADTPNKKTGQDRINELVSGWGIITSAKVADRSQTPAEREAEARREAVLMKSRIELVTCDPSDKGLDSLPNYFLQAVQKQQLALRDQYLIDAAASCPSTKLRVRFEVKAKPPK
jgi:hypothetical protein